jgi:methionyl-tRNA formyltransferase
MQLMPPLHPEKRRLKILLAGYGHLGIAVLQGLLACSDACEVVGVYRWVSTAKGADFWEPLEKNFQQLVTDHALPDIVCPGMNHYQFATVLEKFKPDVVLTASWGDILKPHLLGKEQPLFLNCHPSKLPAHRGANPYASVILAGETETGVTFHKMVPEIDAGPIVLQGTIPLSEHETGETLRTKCAEQAKALTGDLVTCLNAHCLQDVPLGLVEQNVLQKSYYPRLKSEDGQIDWEKSAYETYRHSRAMFPWIACYSYLEGRQKIHLYSPRFVPVQPRTDMLEAGTILSFKHGVLTIALSEPEWVLECPIYQAIGKIGLWPLWVCRLMAPLWFKPGKRFMNIH